MGPAGQKGDTGAGIAALVVTADSRLMAHLTDGRSLDAGPVPRGMPGSDGAKGETGEKGRDGIDGVDGKDGAPGARGDKGLDGAHGRDGIDGKDGAVGLAGRDGIDGKDGAAGLNGKDGAPADLAPVVARLEAVEMALGPALTSDAIAASFDGFLRKELAALTGPAPSRIQKRVIRDVHGKVERVIEEPV